MQPMVSTKDTMVLLGITCIKKGTMPVNYTGQGGQPNNNAGSTFTADVSKIKPFTTNDANKVIPAGAYRVSIHNQAFNDAITVNGENVNPDVKHELYAKLNEVDKVQDFLPQITIANPSAGAVNITVEYPSTSTVDLNTL